MSEQQNNTARHMSYFGAAAFVTFCAVSTGLPPSSGEQRAVNACAAELSDTETHVGTIPDACASYPVYTNGTDMEGYDLLPAAQFVEENSPGLGYDMRWYAIFLVGGVGTACIIRKLGKSLTAEPDSATKRLEAREAARRSDSQIEKLTNRARLPHRQPARANKYVRPPVHDNSPAWLISYAAQKLKEEQRKASGGA